jgi:hypothetical protein
MALDLKNYEQRKVFLEEIQSNENTDRKDQSFVSYEVFNDRLYRYVKEYLLSQFSEKTVLEMPIISSVNIAKRVVVKEASIYNRPPERIFNGLTDDQITEIEELYDKAKINQKLYRSNQYFKLQQQNFIMPLVKNGELYLKCLLPHHVDVIPDDEEPTKADTVILSVEDRSLLIYSDNVNQPIADRDDYQSATKYIVWDKEYNYAFDSKGNLLTEFVEHGLGMLPFIDVNGGKDFEFFVRGGESLTDFAIQYCGFLSDLGNVVKMQGSAVAFIKGAKELMPKSLRVGANAIVHLPIDPNKPVDTDFGFSSPNPDIAGSIQYGEHILGSFLTSRGLDADLISGKGQATKYTSGLDRLLAMVDMFEATKSDYDLFKNVEMQLFEQIKAWSNVTFGTDNQFLSFIIPDNATLVVNYKKPELVQTDQEKNDLLISKLENGMISKLEAIMIDRNISKEDALKVLSEIKKEETLEDETEIES